MDEEQHRKMGGSLLLGQRLGGGAGMGEEQEEGGRATPTCLGWGSGAFVITGAPTPRV